MVSDDWSLTPATLARVAATETFEPTLELDADAERALESHLRALGIDCCGVCAKPEASMGDAAVECATCRAVVYCGAKCEAADAEAHARSCALLASPLTCRTWRVPTRVIAPRRRRRWRPRSTT